MSLEIKQIEDEEFAEGGKGEETWLHSDIQEMLKKYYNQLSEKDGEVVNIEFSEEEFFEDYTDKEKSYAEWVNDTKHPHPTVKRQIKKNLPKVGFSETALEEIDRKSAVGGGDSPDGYRIKIQMIPQEE